MSEINNTLSIFQPKEKSDEPGLNFLPTSRMIASEVLERGYIPFPITEEVFKNTSEALAKDFNKQFHNTRERNKINVYIVQTFLDYFLYLKKNGRANELHVDVLKMLEKF